MNKYFIKLKPLEKFFFGNEINFYKDDVYIVKSNIFPQQTAILGMLRKEILIIKGLLMRNWEYEKIDKNKIIKFIGEKSFDIYSDKAQDFGIIKSISPTFIYDDKDIYIKIPKDHNKSFEGKSYKPFEFSDKEIKTNYGNIKIPIGYDSKKGLSNDFLNINSLEIKLFEEIFIEDIRVRNKKGENGKVEKDGYFKEINYRFINNFQFAFEVEIDDNENILDGYENIVTIGNSESMFKLKAEKIEDTRIKFNEEMFKFKNKIILLSDAYVEKDVFDKCYFTICEGVEFRNIKTNYKSNMSNIFEKNESIFNFIERGSVLYPKDENLEEVKNYFHKNSNLTKIGYNIFMEE